MKIVKKWGGFCVFMALFLAALGTILWYTSRPVTLRAEELTPAVTYESYPGTELSLDSSGYHMSLTISNYSSEFFESGAAVDQNRNFFTIPGVDILQDGTWYKVPKDDYATAGVGLELAPGDSIQLDVSMNPYGELPDGQYRLSFSYTYYDPTWEGSTAEHPDYVEYTLYARFDIVDRKYIPV